ncbi:MAG TPA: 3-isopropylmalate dehydratase large subunit [Firmicutes bacterium]|nr:3-isopropylmalate dehydratase large subunit [Bacillota bacterium]
MGMTIAEKALARNAGLKEVHPGQYVDARIDRVVADEEFYRIHAAAVQGGLKGGLPHIYDKNRFHVVLEHFQPPLNEAQAVRQQLMRKVAKQYGLRYFQDSICAVIHQVVMEDYAHPGELALGTDSHSCAWGALNSVSTGMGEHELAYALTFGELWFKVPESIKIVLTGKLSEIADPKDVMFYLAQQHTASVGLYKSLEFTGSGARNMSLSNRMTMAVHTVELGGKFGIFEYDDKTEEFLNQRIALCKQLDAAAKPIRADADAIYEKTIEINLDEIEPLVAKPHSFENIGTLDAVRGTPIHQAQVGSCANGRLEDLRVVANMVKGRKVHKNTRFLVQPASWRVYRDAMAEGLLDTMIGSGIQILSPGCHLCLGMQGCLGENENAITCTTRNHMGRLGGINCNVYLANPKVVTAAAIEGKIVDIREGF